MAAFNMTMAAAIMILGIGVGPIWQGLVGIKTSLEGFFANSNGRDLNNTNPFTCEINGITVVLTRLDCNSVFAILESEKYGLRGRMRATGKAC
jgi:hypothetical protein